MLLRRLDDDVVIGLGATLFYRRGEVYDITDDVLVAQLLTDPGWAVEPDGGATMDAEPGPYFGPGPDDEETLEPPPPGPPALPLANPTDQ